MSAAPTSSPLQARRHRLRGRLGDLALHGLTLAAALACLVLVGAIVWKILELSGDAFDRFGFGFITGRTWDPVKHVFGALPFIYGTAVSSLVALVMATPLAIAIGLYLSELAPRGVRGIVGSLVELLAAIPSVVLGLWGSSCSARSSLTTSSRRCTARSASSRSSATPSKPGRACSPPP